MAATFPAIYRARATQVNGSSIQAFVPQVFGESSVTVATFLGERPTSPTMGWVMFQGGNPEFPVWAGAGVINITEIEAAEAAGIYVTRDYRWRNVVTATDPGHGFVQCNNLNPSLATEVYLSVYDRDENAYLNASSLQPGDLLAIYLAGNVETRIEYTIAANMTNNTGWLTLPVTVAANYGFTTGIPGNNVSVRVVVQTVGHTAPMPGGVAGDVILKQSAAPGDAIWTKTIPALTVTNLTAPSLGTTNLSVSGSINAASAVDATLATTTHPLTLGVVGGANLALSRNIIQARSNGAAATLSLNPLGGTIQLGGGGTPAQQVRIGDDAYLTDINAAHTMALISTSSASDGWLRLGSQAEIRGASTLLQLKGGPSLYMDGDSQYFRNAAGTNQMTLGGSLLIINQAGGAEALRFPNSGNYQSWYDGSGRIGYLQGNTGQVYLNAERAGVSLRMRGAGGLFLDNGTNNYQLSESVIGTRVVATNGSGYIYGNYFNMTADIADYGTYYAGQNGDGFLRWYRYIDASKVGWGSTAGQIQTTRVAGPFYYDQSFFENPGNTMAGYGWHPGGVAGSLRMQVNSPQYHFNNTDGQGYYNTVASSYNLGSSERFKQEIVPVLQTLPDLPRNPVATMVRALRPVWYRQREDNTMTEVPVRPDDLDSEQEWRPRRDEMFIHFCRDQGPGNCGHTPDDPCSWRVNWLRGQLGFIAEEVEPVLPNLVELDADMKPATIDLGSFVGLAYAMLQEIDTRLTALEATS